MCWSENLWLWSYNSEYIDRIVWSGAPNPSNTYNSGTSIEDRSLHSPYRRNNIIIVLSDCFLAVTNTTQLLLFIAITTIYSHNRPTYSKTISLMYTNTAKETRKISIVFYLSPAHKWLLYLAWSIIKGNKNRNFFFTLCHSLSLLLFIYGLLKGAILLARWISGSFYSYV